MAHRQSTFAVVIGIACLFLTQAGYGQSKPLKKIRVGVPSVGMGNIIIFVTKEGKLFEKYGLDAEVITVMGSGIGSKALISGNLDIIPIATPTVMGSCRSRPAPSRRRRCLIPATGWREKWASTCCGIRPRSSTTPGWKSPRAGRRLKTTEN